MEWQLHVAYLAIGHLPGGDPVLAERLMRVIRSTRQICGGAYARWQDLLDHNDTPGLLAFAASPDALTFGSGLINDLARNLEGRQEYAACRAFLRAAVERHLQPPRVADIHPHGLDVEHVGARVVGMIARAGNGAAGVGNCCKRHRSVSISRAEWTGVPI